MSRQISCAWWMTIPILHFGWKWFFQVAGLQTDVKASHRGDELLAWLETHQKPKLILLALRRPHRSGFDRLKLLRFVDRYKMIPVVTLSVSDTREAVGQAYDRGANAYLVKPGQLSELRRRLTFFP